MTNPSNRHIHKPGERFGFWTVLEMRPPKRRGVVIRDRETGKIAYATILDFDSRAVRDAFSRAVIDAVLRAFPDAFEGGEVAA
jgi:hypothetical protein